MSSEILQETVSSVSWWLEFISKKLDRHEDVFLDLCQRILALPYQDQVHADRPVTEAINHPIGHITQALLNLWFRRKPNDNDKLPIDLEPIFTQLCNTNLLKFRHGRVLLASRAIALFRVDKVWAEMNLLPLFDWTKNAAEARAAWEGFLWSPRLYAPLQIAFKAQFLETVHHYTDLGGHAEQFASFLTFAALEPLDNYTVQDFQAAFDTLPQNGLDEAGRALARALEGAGEQKEEYWTHRVQPFWARIWPKSSQLASNSIAESVARICIAARGRFPVALSTVHDWLQPIQHFGLVVHLLNESGLCKQFPKEALNLLDIIIDDQPWPPQELEECLTTIAEVMPSVEQDNRYKRLLEYLRRHNNKTTI
jgi:hypothetical protein